MSTFDAFTCAECGHSVELRTGPGRTREIARGFPVAIPTDFAVPTCTSCGEVYFLPEIAARLDPVLREETMKMQARHYRELVDILTRRHGVAQKVIVRACGVTPSHLSHILAGKCLASDTLTRLLEAFTACPLEFARNMEGRPYSSASVFPFLVKPTAPSPQWLTAGAGANDTRSGTDGDSDCGELVA